MNFQVVGMTCGGCINAIKRTINSSDPKALINIDLASQHVEVTSTMPAEEIKKLIEIAGFSVSAS
tara:strand:- start:268 stop:462 length:195 start_codon:yes stop_codon:yes gene_type:complete